MDQCWIIINCKFWNKLHWNFNRKSIFDLRDPISSGNVKNGNACQPSSAEWLLTICFKNLYESVYLEALGSSFLKKSTYLSMYGWDILSGFQRVPLKFHTKYLTHPLKDTIFFIRYGKFESSQIYEYAFLKRPLAVHLSSHGGRRPVSGF